MSIFFLFDDDANTIQFQLGEPLPFFPLQMLKGIIVDEEEKLWLCEHAMPLSLWKNRVFRTTEDRIEAANKECALVIYGMLLVLTLPK